MHLIFVLILLMTGCSTLLDIISKPQILNPAVYYKNDICFSYKDKNLTRNFYYRNGHARDLEGNDDKDKVIFCGVGILPYRKKYKITVDSFSKINFFAMNTCHREITTESPDRGFFKKDGIYKVYYVPMLEESRACPLYVGSFNRHGRNGWGTVVFEHPNYKLKAKVSCNGDYMGTVGTSICQTREGLTQKIVFDEPVKAARPVNGPAQRVNDCPILPTNDDKTFKFIMPNRECVYGFIGRKSGKMHVFYTVGYEQLIVRE